MKDARLVVAGNENAEFVWTHIEGDKWVERFYKKFEEGWSLIHKVEFLTQSAVEEFARKLQENGFALTIA